MLPLQLKSLLPKLPRKSIFLAKLLLFSASMHLIFFLVLFIIQTWKSTARIRLHDISDGAAVVLVPLIKTITPEICNKKSVPIVKEIAQKKMPVTQHIPLPKEAAAHEKTEIVEKKSVLPKKLPAPAKKPQQPLKKVPEKKAEAKKDIIKKSELPVQASNAVQKMPPMVDTATTTTVQHVGHYDVALITLCNEIKAGIATTWRRPTNIPSTEQCHVKVCVRSETERTVSIMKSSRAVALDIMVKNFVMRYPFPRALWHTDIELIF